MTGYSEAQRRSTQKYRQNKVDQLAILVPKGEKEQIKAAAEKAGQSISQFVLQAVRERMERDNG